MPGGGTIGGLVGKLDVPARRMPDARRARPLPRRTEEFGLGYRVTDWLSERTGDCRKRTKPGVTGARGAIMPDLVDLPY
jgi:hypothetical protein